MTDISDRNTRMRALDALAAYGADPGRWPEGDRALFAAFANDYEFSLALEDARALDAALDIAAPTPPEALSQRILADYDAVVSRPRPARLFIPRWLTRAVLPAGLFAGLTALGFIAGAATATTWQDDLYLYAEDAGLFSDSDLADSLREAL